MDDKKRKAKRLLIEQNRARKAAERQMQLQNQQQQLQQQQQPSVSSSLTGGVTHPQYPSDNRALNQPTTAAATDNAVWAMARPENVFPNSVPQAYPMAQNFRLAEQALPPTCQAAITSMASTTTTSSSEKNNSIDVSTTTRSEVKMEEEAAGSEKSAPHYHNLTPAEKEVHAESNIDGESEEDNGDYDGDDDEDDGDVNEVQSDDSDGSYTEEEFPKCYLDPYSDEAALHFTQGIVEACQSFHNYPTKVVRQHL